MSALFHSPDDARFEPLTEAWLDALALWSRSEGAQWLWLEVRRSNLRAQKVYLAHGYRRVGERKRYYPSLEGQREDAVVMSLKL
ncbi:MAG: Ribosomal-protein-alanine acetyltransferase [Xylophilus sp.]|nr:MAG: Ribosomal-protein-alanine acetyltransferase [Xylophilus sp.]